jgi:tetratricopeptide (TPR) repeat protein
MAQKKRRSSVGSRKPAANLPSAEVTLDRLLGALPELGDIAALRQALLRASVPDAARAWSRSSAYATMDKRVLNSEVLRDIVANAAQAEHERIDALYDALGAVLESVAQMDESGAALRLIEIGEAAESDENLQSAVTYFEAAARLGAALTDAKPRILALRHLGRAHLGLGDMETAAAFYRTSLEQAVAAGEIELQVICLTGLGNTLSYQGDWNGAIAQYEAALMLCGSEYPRRRGQLGVNLASMHRERGELTQSAHFITAASECWADMTAEDHAAWYNNRGLLALAAREFEAAETNFRQGLETAASDFTRAMILDNLAELCIQRDELADAETFARAAEERAVGAGSPRALAEIYTRLGKIFRLRADLNGVTFFEKALEICRGRRYPLTEANAYLEYGLFRRTLGDTEEARSYLERARQLCADIGAAQLERAAQDLLA